MPRTVVQELTPPPGMTPPFRITPGYGAAGYADAGVIVPWTLYTTYGDRQLLEDCYPGMMRWAEHVLEWVGDGLIVENWFQFGYRLAPNASTIPDLAATAYFAYSLQLLRRIATLLGQTADAGRFEALSGTLRAAFCTRFVQADGRMEPASQSAYVLALAFDLLPDELHAPAAALLVEDIRRAATTSPPASWARRGSAECWWMRAIWTLPTICCCRRATRRGSTPSRRAQPQSGSAGTASSRTERSSTRR